MLYVIYNINDIQVLMMTYNECCLYKEKLTQVSAGNGVATHKGEDKDKWSSLRLSQIPARQWADPEVVLQPLNLGNAGIYCICCVQCPLALMQLHQTFRTLSLPAFTWLGENCPMRFLHMKQIQTYTATGLYFAESNSK